MSTQNISRRIWKAAPYAIIGLLIIAAGLFGYFILPSPVGQSILLLAVCLIAGISFISIGVYLLLIGEVKAPYRLTGKTMGAGLVMAAMILIGSGLIYYIVLPPPYGQSIGLLGGAIVAGLVFIVAGLYFYFRETKKTMMDERSIRVGAHAGNIAFIISWALLSLLAILTSFGILQISFKTIVLVLMMGMPWIYLIIRFILGRRGEPV